MTCIQHGAWGDHCGPECRRITNYWNRRPHRFYKFAGRSANGKTYIWEGPETGDGRVEIVTCDVAYFWRHSPEAVA